MVAILAGTNAGAATGTGAGAVTGTDTGAVAGAEAGVTGTDAGTRIGEIERSREEE